MNNEILGSGLSEKDMGGVLNEHELEISKRELVKEFEIGDYGVAASVDALHATPPSNEEIYQVVVRENQGVDNVEVIVKEIIKDVDRRALEYRKNNPKAPHKKVLSEVAKELGDDILYYRIIHLKKLYEQGTDEIARVASEVAGSSFMIACSRIKEDWNRPEDARDISNKAGKPLEMSYRAHLVERALYTESLGSQGLLDEAGELNRPFIHVSIHGCAKFKGGSDIFIANGVKDGGKLPCEPEIARWFEGKIRAGIKSNNLLNSRHEPLRVHVATEGQRLSGSTANVRRRFGMDGSAKGWGKLFQYVQFEVGPYARSFHRREIGEIVGGAVKDFTEAFPTAESLDRYTRDNETPIDINRREGSLAVSNLHFSGKVGDGYIAANSDFRNALATREGDTLEVSILGDNSKTAKIIQSKTVIPHYTLKKQFITLPLSLEDTATQGVIISKPKEDINEQ